jgi:hypothetical protein
LVTTPVYRVKQPGSAGTVLTKKTGL